MKSQSETAPKQKLDQRERTISIAVTDEACVVHECETRTSANESIKFSLDRRLSESDRVQVVVPGNVLCDEKGGNVTTFDLTSADRSRTFTVCETPPAGRHPLTVRAIRGAGSTLRGVCRPDGQEDGPEKVARSRRRDDSDDPPPVSPSMIIQ
jgi:hypothetical protein